MRQRDTRRMMQMARDYAEGQRKQELNQWRKEEGLPNARPGSALTRQAFCIWCLTNGMLRDFPGNTRVMNWWVWYDKYKVMDSISLAVKMYKILGQAVSSRQRNLEFYRGKKN